MSKLTGRSYPFKSSFKPVSGKTNRGAETLVKFRAFASSRSNVSFTNLIATSVSNNPSFDL
jgi:hypothetical protein